MAEQRQIAASAEGFVQGIVNLLAHKYVYWSSGEVAEGQDAEAVDRTLARKFETEITRWERARRRKLGRGSVRYLRFENTFVLLAQPGSDRWTDGEPWKDARRRAIWFRGYVISYRLSTVTGRYHASVGIDPVEYQRLKAWMLELATHRSVENMRRELQRLPFEPYARVRRQYLNILREVNRRRRAAGFELVPNTAVRLHRRRPRVYAESAESFEKDIKRQLELIQRLAS